MAICHVRCSSGSRGGGQSGAAKVAYVLREGKYEPGRDDLVASGSGNLPAWAEGDARALFAAADVYERANGRLFVEVESALPSELDAKQRGALVGAWVEELASGKLPYAYAVHAGHPKAPGEVANPHVHVVLSERVNDGVSRDAAGWFRRANRKDPASGGAAKDRRLKDRSWVEATRGRWERLVNAHLERAGRPERITAESHATRIERAEAAGDRATAEHLRRHPPGRHLGPAAAAIERARKGRLGQETERGELARATAAETARLREELAAVDRQLRRLREESERPRAAEARPPAPATREDARSAPSGVEAGPQVPERSEAARERAGDVPRPDTGGGRPESPATPTPAPVPPAIPYEEQVRLAADAAEARLPRTTPSAGDPDVQPLAVSDETLDHLAAGTEDRFVRDTIAAVRERQPSHEAQDRARSEADRQAAAVAREHARLVAEHQEAARRPGPRRKPESPAPSWEDAVRAIFERYLLELRRVFEEACAWVREQLQARPSEARDAPAGAESRSPDPESSRSTSDRVNDVPPPGVGRGRTGGEAARAPAEAPRPPAEPPAPVVVAIPHEERVRLAADTAEARLPRAKPAPGNPMHQPLAVSDRSLDRLAATTEDRFVRDTIVAVRSRQLPYDAYYRTRAEEDHHAPAINREHARLVAEHEQATRRRWWQLHRPESPKPAWEDAARKVIERSLPEVRLVFMRACVQTPEFRERWVVEPREDAEVRMPGPAGPGPGRREDRAPDRDHETGGEGVGSSSGQKAPASRVEQLLEERARIEQLYEQAREMNFRDGRDEVERAAREAEDALERQVRELPGSEQRDLQSREQTRGLDRGGPSR